MRTRYHGLTGVLGALLLLPAMGWAGGEGPSGPDLEASRRADSGDKDKKEAKGDQSEKDDKGKKDDPAAKGNASQAPPAAEPAGEGDGDEGNPEDLGDMEAGGSTPGREGGGGSSDIFGAEDVVPPLGDANVEGTPRVKITLRNGTLMEGKLTHVVRGGDKWNADPKPQSQFTINVDVHELTLDWKTVKTVTGKDPNTSTDVDCWTNQDAVPLEYECTLAQPTYVRMKGTHQYAGDYKVVDKEPYVFVLDGDPKKSAFAYLYKIPLKIQDDGTPETEALAKLQEALKERNKRGLKLLTVE